MSVRKGLQPMSIFIYFETSLFFGEPMAKVRRLAEENFFVTKNAKRSIYNVHR